MWINPKNFFQKKRIFKAHLVPRPQIQTQVPLLTQQNRNWELEIGAGDGEFSLNRASQDSSKNIIAIEKTRNQFKRFTQKEKRPNLWFLHTNAVWWVTHFVPERFLNSIFILYPNPYPKKKQAHLRWVQRPFMNFLLSRLKQNGILEIRTNEFFYFQETQDQMRMKFPFMRCEEASPLQNQKPQTAFERKYLSRMPCYVLKFMRS